MKSVNYIQGFTPSARSILLKLIKVRVNLLEAFNTHRLGDKDEFITIILSSFICKQR